MEFQLVLDPGCVVQGFGKPSGGEEGLDHLPVVFHVMAQFPVLAFPALQDLVMEDLLVELAFQIFPLQALPVDPGRFRHQQGQVIKDQQDGSGDQAADGDHGLEVVEQQVDKKGKEADDDPDINGMHFPVFRDLSAEIADADHKGADEQEPEGLLQPVKGDVPGHDHCNGEDQDRKVEQAEEGKDPRVCPGKFQRDIPV